MNTLSPGDRVLMFETGHFAALWRELAERLGLDVDYVPGRLAPRRRCRRCVERKLRRRPRPHDQGRRGRAQRNLDGRHQPDRRGAPRRSIARAHPALLLVDTISSLGSIDYRHDEWGVDVTVGGSQKGLMLPPGLGFNAVSEKALAASASARSCRGRTGTGPTMLAPNADRVLPLHAGDEPALRPARGARHAVRGGAGERVRAPHAVTARRPARAVRAWGLEICASEPRRVQQRR